MGPLTVANYPMYPLFKADAVGNFLFDKNGDKIPLKDKNINETLTLKEVAEKFITVFTVNKDAREV